MIRTALALTTAAAAAAALVLTSDSAPLAAEPVFGPPWLAVEYPANPWDRTTRDAVVLVHAYHHGTPMSYPVTGTAEGLVSGKRQSVALQVEPTGRAGVYAVRRTWGNEGRWALVLTLKTSETDGVQALVELDGEGVARATVPTRNRGGDPIPRALTKAEIEAALR